MHAYIYLHKCMRVDTHTFFFFLFFFNMQDFTLTLKATPESCLSFLSEPHQTPFLFLTSRSSATISLSAGSWINEGFPVAHPQNQNMHPPLVNGFTTIWSSFIFKAQRPRWWRRPLMVLVMAALSHLALLAHHLYHLLHSNHPGSIHADVSYRACSNRIIIHCSLTWPLRRQELSVT